MHEGNIRRVTILDHEGKELIEISLPGVWSAHCSCRCGQP